MIDRNKFFAAVRINPFPGRLEQKQVDGLEAILTAFEVDYRWPDLRWLAYCLATAFHETAATMQPIKEYGSESYLRGKPYYPYFGRGYVQLTWEANYKKLGTKVGTDLMGVNKDRALDPAIAAEIMFSGMRDGDFTGKKLADYFSPTKDDPINARRIISGTDRADLVAKYHDAFLDALDASVTGQEPVSPVAAVDETVWIRRKEVADRLRALAAEIERAA